MGKYGIFRPFDFFKKFNDANVQYIFSTKILYKNSFENFPKCDTKKYYMY